MSTDRALIGVYPAGEQALVEYGKEPVIADTFSGRVQVEWETGKARR